MKNNLKVFKLFQYLFLKLSTTVLKRICALLQISQFTVTVKYVLHVFVHDANYLFDLQRQKYEHKEIYKLDILFPTFFGLDFLILFFTRFEQYSFFVIKMFSILFIAYFWKNIIFNDDALCLPGPVVVPSSLLLESVEPQQVPG